MILITGVNGQLGYDVCLEQDSIDLENRGVDIGDFDLTDEKQVRTMIERNRPDSVIHCTAYTAVDKAESDRERCYAVDVNGTRFIAEACRDIKAKMVYISTDYVFDGTGDKPWEVTDAKNPINYYGLTKSIGEDEVRRLVNRHFTVRTSWVYGSNGNNFVKTMLRLGKGRDVIKVVTDQICSPTYTIDLSKLLCKMIQTDRFGVYHATNEEYCSWYEFAKEIIGKAGCRCKVEGISGDKYPTAARRPRNSRLDKRMLSGAGFGKMSSWRKAIDNYLTEIEN
jgi:dTDP-4-dehydrorhamnose reductase